MRVIVIIGWSFVVKLSIGLISSIYCRLPSCLTILSLPVSLQLGEMVAFICYCVFKPRY
jgi:hypothetical protein